MYAYFHISRPQTKTRLKSTEDKKNSLLAVHMDHVIKDSGHTDTM